MSDTEHNPPAFAAVAFDPSSDFHLQDGMSLRDYFAGQSLVGLLANPKMIDPINIMAEKSGKTQADIQAVFCYEMADAMLEARKNG